MSGISDAQMSDEPVGRLAALTAEMTKILDQPENADVKAIIFLDDETDGGIQLYRYEDANEAMAHVFMHMQAVFESQGKHLEFVGVPDSPEDLT